MNFLIDFLVKIIKQAPNDVILKVIDKALDPLEEWLQKDGLTAWEKVMWESIQFVRRSLKITEEEGSAFSDK